MRACRLHSCVPVCGCSTHVAPPLTPPPASPAPAPTPRCMQLIVHTLGGEVKEATEGGEYGRMPMKVR